MPHPTQQFSNFPTGNQWLNSGVIIPGATGPYYVLPWFNNTETKSDNSHPIPGYDPFCDKIIQQFHTHLTENPIYITSGVSSGDIEFSYKNKMPVNAIYSNNKVYTFYWHAPYSQTWSSDAFPDGKGGYGFLNTKY